MIKVEKSVVLLFHLQILVHPHSIVVWHTAQQQAFTGHWGFCGTYGKHFPRFEFFLLPSIVHARSIVANADRGKNKTGKQVL